MTMILKAISPRDDRGNDPNDFRDDPEYLSRILESAAANGRPVPAPATETLSGAFRYVEHRTTTRGRLVLDFVHAETGQIASMFFNVNIENPRTGTKYRVGRSGQFTTRPGHKFRTFWGQVIGEQPRRSWSRIHTELHRLRSVEFIGLAVGRETYWNLESIRKS